MIMADIFLWVFLILGLLLTINAVWLATTALFPEKVQKFSQSYSRPLRQTLTGVAVVIPVLLVATVLAKGNPVPIKIVGVALVGLLVLMGLAGSAGLASRIGRGLPSARDIDSPWRTTLRGGIVLSLTFILPFIGWFGILLWTLVSGVGSVALNLRARAQSMSEVAESSDSPPPMISTPEATQVD